MSLPRNLKLSPTQSALLAAITPGNELLEVESFNSRTYYVVPLGQFVPRTAVVGSTGSPMTVWGTVAALLARGLLGVSKGPGLNSGITYTWLRKIGAEQ